MPYHFTCPVLEGLTYWESRYEFEQERRKRRAKERKNEILVTEREKRIVRWRPQQRIKIVTKDLYLKENYERVVQPKIKRVFLTIVAKDSGRKFKNSFPIFLNNHLERFSLKPVSFLTDILKKKHILIVIQLVIRELGLDLALEVIDFF